VVTRTVCLTALVAVGCGGAKTAQVVAARSARTPAPVVEVAAARAPLRRLTRDEYNHAVRDLLGDASRPADAFPPDEDIGGFESNGVAPVTQLLVERYMDAAHAVAEAAAPRIDAIAPCAPGELKQRCASKFIGTFGRLAFRRPLCDGERAALLALYTDKERRSDYAGGIELVVEAMLEAPQFLYRVELPEAASTRAGARPLDGYAIATRLSFFLWASTPDARLLDDAAAGELATRADVERAARRMLADRRAVDGLRSFHRQWLGLARLETEQKDAALFPAFTPELKDAMVEETLRFCADAVLAGGDTVKTLLTSNVTFVNAPLAKLYGVAPPSGGGFARVTLPARERAGVLTQASVMSALAAADQTSPVLRGKFVREQLLCDSVPPPPPDVSIARPKVDPRLTTKQRFAQHRADAACAGCHAMMDPIGFGFEHYDGIGAWRAAEGRFAIDASGEVTSTDDVNVAFDGAVELGARLAASKQVRRCLATQWLRYALGRSEQAEDAASLDGAYRAFERAGFDVRELIVAIAASDAFRFVRVEAAP
jgi:hypothetical protein